MLDHLFLVLLKRWESTLQLYEDLSFDKSEFAKQQIFLKDFHWRSAGVALVHDT